MGCGVDLRDGRDHRPSERRRSRGVEHDDAVAVTTKPAFDMKPLLATLAMPDSPSKNQPCADTCFGTSTISGGVCATRTAHANSRAPRSRRQRLHDSASAAAARVDGQRVLCHERAIEHGPSSARPSRPRRTNASARGDGVRSPVEMSASAVSLRLYLRSATPCACGAGSRRGRALPHGEHARLRPRVAALRRAIARGEHERMRRRAQLVVDLDEALAIAREAAGGRPRRRGGRRRPHDAIDGDAAAMRDHDAARLDGNGRARKVQHRAPLDEDVAEARANRGRVRWKQRRLVGDQRESRASACIVEASRCCIASRSSTPPAPPPTTAIARTPPVSASVCHTVHVRRKASNGLAAARARRARHAHVGRRADVERQHLERLRASVPSVAVRV
jgi:hypothetical protein